MTQLPQRRVLDRRSQENFEQLQEAIAVLRSGWINVKDSPYNAKGDGSGADDAPAIQAALDDASADGKVAYAPAGDYGLKSQLEIDQYASLWGDGMWGTTFSRLVDGAGLHFNPWGSNSRGGACGGFRIDGNNVTGAAQPLMLVESVNRNFYDFRIDTMSANDTALQCNTAQNCLFDGFDLQSNPDYGGPSNTIGIDIDLGASGLNFTNFRTNQFTGSHIVIHQTDAPQSPVGAVQPTHISFTNFMVERGAPTTLLFNIRDGRAIWIENGNLSLSTYSATGPSGTLPTGSFDVNQIQSAGTYGSAITRGIYIKNVKLQAQLGASSTKYGVGWNLDDTNVYTTIEDCEWLNCNTNISVESGHQLRLSRPVSASYGSWVGGSGEANQETIASAGTINVDDFSPTVKITGTADIETININNFQADKNLVLIFTDTAATNGVVDGSNLKLNGNFAYTANDTLTLRHDQTNWYEVGRSAN